VPAAVEAWAEKLPNLAPDEHMTVVETISIYNAPFRWGLKGFEMENFVFTRPRYAPAVHWGNG
jgi:hypothetical protein